MEWIAAGLAAWLTGSLGYFIVIALLAMAFPRTMMVLTYGCMGPVVWGGSTIILGFIGGLAGFFPATPQAFTLAAFLTAIPSALFVHKLATGISGFR